MALLDKRIHSPPHANVEHRLIQHREKIVDISSMPLLIGEGDRLISTLDRLLALEKGVDKENKKLDKQPRQLRAQRQRLLIFKKWQIEAIEKIVDPYGYKSQESIAMEKVNGKIDYCNMV